MKLRYWLDFNKRQNSTKRPDLTKGTEIEVYIKDDCSLENPVFVVSDNLKTWSYCYAPSLGRYYFITDIVTVDSWQFEVHCTLDAAATYRDSILAYTAFVERAASAYDVLLNDNFLSTQQDIIYNAHTNINIHFGNGFYVVPVSGAEGVQQVVFTNPDNASLFYNGYPYSAKAGDGTAVDLATCFQDGNAFKAMFQQIGYSFMNPTDYMGDMLFFPMDYADMTVASRPLRLGVWTYKNGDVTMLDGYSRVGWSYHTNLTFPASPYTDFRKYNDAFTQYYVYLPCFGNIQIPAIDAGQGDLGVYINVDTHSGAGQYVIYHTTGNDVIGTYSTQIGINVSYAKSNGINFGNLITTAIGGAQNVAGAGGIGAGGAASMGLGLERMGIDTIRAFFATCPSICGGSGNGASARLYPNIITSTRAVGSKEFPVAECGRPLCQNVTLGSLSGFVKCGNASVPLVALDHVRSEINNMLNSGIYIE